MEILTVDTFPHEYYRSLKVQKRKRGNPGTTGNNKRDYLDIVCAFDIETTRLDNDQSVIYHWQFQLGLYATITGRTWEEFTRLCDILRAPLDADTWIVVYVHNLSFEFQFLAGVYDFSPHEVFAVKSRKILKCDMFDHIEIRCSYLHSNMSLSLFLRKMKAEHQKISGDEFDYRKKRYPHTPVTDLEMEYMQNDVLGLVEALTNEMKNDGDNLYSIPLTSTGYVRRDAKLAMRSTPVNYVKNMLPDWPVYEILREAFRGGNTHANRFFSNMILHNVKSADRSSSYPDVQINDPFPVSRFQRRELSPEEAVKMIKRGKHCFVTRLALKDVELINKNWGCPYLSKDKCRNIDAGIYDNGRILSAGYLETTLTDIDFRIVISQYQFSGIVLYDTYVARYGQLPPAYKACIIDYYKRKTELKDVEGREVEYTKSKNKLNSIYGMSAQDPVRALIDFADGEFVPRETIGAEQLEDYNRRAFLPYQWGVWTTAHARYRLEEGIRLAGDNFVYCDTDSVKYLGEIDWTAYNKDRIDASTDNGAFATDPAGVTHFMGVYEQEAEYITFKTMGAKKYGYTYADGKTHVTIAGVNKAKGGKELDKHGGVSAMTEGFVFTEAGGTELLYNDNPSVTEYTADGHTYPITRNVTIKDSTYQLGLTAEYSKLLAMCNMISIREAFEK